MLSFFGIAAPVLVLSAVFGWVNRRFIGCRTRPAC